MMQTDPVTIVVKGNIIDNATRCTHYHSANDIIAIRFNCCNEYYPCYQCHEETAGHAATVWPKTEWNTKAILCGNCKQELNIAAYMQSGNHCPHCKAAFNPNCSKHYHLYFETDQHTDQPL
ncbi:MAG: hypothetical protein K2Q24_17245 [Chitinophagaceae bacterium]|jgi:uncharacterized CHY-type Zn-finger protein|nr:hypothetical protein [Chitinophagaceae bacterium]